MINSRGQVGYLNRSGRATNFVSYDPTAPDERWKTEPSRAQQTAAEPVGDRTQGAQFLPGRAAKARAQGLTTPDPRLQGQFARGAASLIPGVSSAADVYDAYKSARQGNYGQAGLSLGAAGLGLIPAAAVGRAAAAPFRSAKPTTSTARSAQVKPADSSADDIAAGEVSGPPPAKSPATTAATATRQEPGGPLPDVRDIRSSASRQEPGSIGPAPEYVRGTGQFDPKLNTIPAAPNKVEPTVPTRPVSVTGRAEPELPLSPPPKPAPAAAPAAEPFRITPPPKPAASVSNEPRVLKPTPRGPGVVRPSDSTSTPTVITPTVSRGRDPGTQARMQAARSDNPAVAGANDPFKLTPGARPAAVSTATRSTTPGVSVNPVDDLRPNTGRSTPASRPIAAQAAASTLTTASPTTTRPAPTTPELQPASSRPAPTTPELQPASSRPAPTGSAEIRPQTPAGGGVGDDARLRAMQYLAGLRPDASGQLSTQQGGAPGINPAAWSQDQLNQFARTTTVKEQYHNPDLQRIILLSGR